MSYRGDITSLILDSAWVMHSVAKDVVAVSKVVPGIKMSMVVVVQKVPILFHFPLLFEGLDQVLTLLNLTDIH